MENKSKLIAAFIAVSLLSIPMVRSLRADAQGGNTAAPTDSGRYTIISSGTANGTFPGQIVFTGTSYRFYVTGSTGYQLSGTTNTF